MPLTTALTSMPGGDLVNLVQQLTRTWGPHEENTALLLETLTAQVDWNWADRTIDPEDPEVKAEQAKRKKAKPPKHPILRPVAHRPAEQDEARWQDYVQQLKMHTPAPVDPWEQLQVWKQQNNIA